jgi:hypothetical protein
MAQSGAGRPSGFAGDATPLFGPAVAVAMHDD